MATGTPNLVFEPYQEASVVISYQTKFHPSDAEWDAWLQASQNLKNRTGALRILVVTEGGHPTKPQIDRLKAVNDSNPLTAIVSSSSALRFFAAALTFVNPRIRCFAPSEMDRALQHIGVPLIYRDKVEALVTSLQGRLVPLSQAV